MLVAERMGDFDDDRDRLHRDERQRPDLRRRRADRDARLHPLPRGRPGGLRRDRRRAAPRRRARRRSRSPAARSPRSATSSRAASSAAARSASSALDAIVDGGAGRARRRADRPALVRPALERLHARPPGAAPSVRARRRPARPAARRGPARADRDLRARRCSSCSRSPVDVRGLAHITGDGLNNLTRLAAPVGYEISDPLERAARLRPDRRARRRRATTRCTRSSTWAAASSAWSRPPTRKPPLELLRGHYPAAKRIGTVTDRAGVVERR